MQLFFLKMNLPEQSYGQQREAPYSHTKCMHVPTKVSYLWRTFGGQNEAHGACLSLLQREERKKERKFGGTARLTLTVSYRQIHVYEHAY